MKRHILFILLLFCILPSLQGQKSNKISVLQQQLNEKPSDSLRVVLLSRLAWEFRRDFPAKADSLVILALSLSQPNESKFALGIGLAKKVSGYLRASQGEKNNAIQLYQGAIDALTPGSYFEEMASVYLLMGNLMFRSGELDKSVDYYYEGIRSAESCNNKELKAIISTMVADVKIEQKDFEAAFSFFKDAIKIQEQINAPGRLAMTYYSLGSLYGKTNSLDSALIYYDKAAAIFKKIKTTKELSMVMSGNGNILLQKGKLNEALQYYDKSFELKKKLNDTIGIAHAYYHEGNVLFKQKYYGVAKLYIDSCLEIANEKNIATLIPDAYKKLSEINEKTAKPKQALIDYKKHIKYRDVILNKEKETQIKEVEEKYDNEVLKRINQQQIAFADQDKIIRNSIIGVLGLILIIAFLLARYYQQKRKTAIQMATQKEKLYEQEMFQIRQTAEIRAMNAQQDGQEKERKRIAEALHNSMGSLLSAIQMHFQTISEAVTFQQGDTQVLFNKSLELIKEAAVTNRDIAHDMMPPILMKFGLGAALDSLAQKMESPGIQVSTSVFGLDKRLPEELELSLYRIIDELINNILKHAKANEVSIQLIEHEDLLNIIVEDNGVGFDYNPKDTKYGMGLNNIMTRINHFKGRFEIDSSSGNGTTIIIDIPQETYRGSV